MRIGSTPFAFALVITLFTIQASGAVEWEDLHTDREAFTPSTFLEDRGSVLVETSYVFVENRQGGPTNNLPELLLRIGGGDIIEWRLGLNYSMGSQGNVVTNVEVGEAPIDGHTLYESNVLYGFKLRTSRQSGILPESCFLMEASTPCYGEQFGTIPVATQVFGWQLTGGFRIDAAIRYSFVEGETTWFNRWSPSVVLRIPVTERLEWHAEYFGTFTQGLPNDVNRPFASPGMHIMLAPRVEAGIRVGWGLTVDAADFFSDAGLAWRY